MATLFKSYYCKHPENKDSRTPEKTFAVPLNCPMAKTQPDKFCEGCEYLEIKTELV